MGRDAGSSAGRELHLVGYLTTIPYWPYMAVYIHLEGLCLSGPGKMWQTMDGCQEPCCMPPPAACGGSWCAPLAWI
jgi:hypothetical protein